MKYSATSDAFTVAMPRAIQRFQPAEVDPRGRHGEHRQGHQHGEDAQQDRHGHDVGDASPWRGRGGKRVGVD